MMIKIGDKVQRMFRHNSDFEVGTEAIVTDISLKGWVKAYGVWNEPRFLRVVLSEENSAAQFTQERILAENYRSLKRQAGEVLKLLKNLEYAPERKTTGGERLWMAWDDYDDAEYRFVKQVKKVI